MVAMSLCDGNGGRKAILSARFGSGSTQHASGVILGMVGEDGLSSKGERWGS